MELLGKAKRVRIYLSRGDTIGHKPAAAALLELLRDERAAGATVFEGALGLGASGQVRTNLLVDVQPHLPVVVEWIDAPERVARLLPRIAALVQRGLVTVDDTEVALWSPHGVRDVPSRVTVGEVMSRDVASVAPSAPVRELVEQMLGKVVRALPVVQDGRPVGIVTNSDLLDRGGLGVRLELLPSLGEAGLGEELERVAQAQRTAGEVMTPQPVTAREDEPVAAAAQRMAQRRLKRLPVVDGQGRLVGVVSRLDLLRTVAGPGASSEPAPREVGLRADLAVAQAMRRDVPVVHPEAGLGEVLQAVIATRLNRALVVDADRRVLGAITDAELLDRVTPALRPSALRALMHRLPLRHHDPAEEALEHHARARTAADLMVAEVARVRDTAPLREAIGAMLHGAHKLVAVLDADGRLVGVLDRADVLHALVRGAS